MRVEFGYNGSDKLPFWGGYVGVQFAVGYFETISKSFKKLSKSE